MNSVESSRNSGEGGFTSVLASKGVYYDSADDHEDEGDESINDLDDPSSKKRRLNDDQRLQRW